MRDGAIGSPSLSPRPGRNLGPVVRNELHLGVSVLPPWGWPRCGRAGKLSHDRYSIYVPASVARNSPEVDPSVRTLSDTRVAHSTRGIKETSLDRCSAGIPRAMTSRSSITSSTMKVWGGPWYEKEPGVKAWRIQCWVMCSMVPARTGTSNIICALSESAIACLLVERTANESHIGNSFVNLHPHSIPVATHDPRSPRAVVGIRPADLLRSVYVVGKTGTGKSTFLENLLLRSADAGFGVALIDPHGDLFSRVLENLPSQHWNRVAILRPADAGRPVGVNLLSALAWGSRTLVASGVIEVFRTLWGPTLFGPRSEHVLRHAVLAVLENPSPTLLSLLRFLIDPQYRTRALARVTDPVVRVFWAKEFPALGKQFASEVTAPVLNKLGALASPVVRRLVGQAAPRMDLRKLMDDRRILIADLSGIGRDAAQFIGALLVTGLDLAAHARAGKPAAERAPFLVVADEFHAYLTRSFISLLSEGRKFGVCAALAHQHAAQLDPEVRAAILGNTGTLAAFALSAEDAEATAPEFAPELGAADLVRLRRHHMALRLLKNGEPARPMIVRTLPPIPASGDVPATLLRISAERYGRPSTVVDREIREALGASPRPTIEEEAA